MLSLALSVGEDRFALGCADVVEVIPRVELRSIPHAPAFVPGLFTYRGAIVPVIDLCQLIRQSACPSKLSSRIIIVKPRGGTNRLIGLLAERVIDTIHLDPKQAIPAGIEIADTPYLGEVYLDVAAGTTTQRLVVDGLVAGPLRGMMAERATRGLVGGIE
ncbi:MAG TPA: chemotaxis protein CheW [Kofleriaceae bacterium]